MVAEASVARPRPEKARSSFEVMQAILNGEEPDGTPLWDMLDQMRRDSPRAFLDRYEKLEAERGEGEESSDEGAKKSLEVLRDWLKKRRTHSKEDRDRRNGHTK